MLPHFSDGELITAAHDVIREERGEHICYMSPGEAFDYRFANTKAGSHSAQSSRIARGYMDELPDGELTQRNFVEALHTNPLLKLPPATWVSRSEKLEHGKSRALFACDTINYLHFDEPCRAVERAWRNSRCIIRPGGGKDMHDIATRGASLGKCKIMLDFADFNSAHTLTVMLGRLHVRTLVNPQVSKDRRITL